MKFCIYNGKVRHETWDGAHEQLLSLRRHRRSWRRKKIRGRTYKCSHCNGWHVSGIGKLNK